MAYMSQELKKKLTANAKAVLKKYGVKGTFSVYHHSTLVCTIKSGPIDFITNINETLETRPGGFRGNPKLEKYIDVNVYHFREHFTGTAKDFLTELIIAMNNGNWDKSDIMTDYFDVGWYIDVHIGKWNKEYVLEK